MPTPEFVHLHLHTQYSLLDGAIRIPDLIARARTYKMPALAVTDHGNLFGAMEFYTQVQSNGIKPIIGCEVYVAPGSRKKQGARVGEVTSYHLVLLCENEKGYRNLCRLVTRAYQEGFYYKPRIDRELLEQFNEGLICLSGCLSGEVPSLLLKGDEKGALERAAWFRDLFTPERYYLELQVNGLEEQTKVNRGLVELAGKLDLKAVATNDCHYLDRTDHRVHEILLCIQTGKQLSDTDRLSFETDEFYFKSPEEMARDFQDMPDALSTSLAIAERCSLLLEFGEPHMPRFDPGPNETLRQRFEKEARAGFVTRIEKAAERGDVDPSRVPEYRDRLDREIRLIQEKGFSGYFLIVADFIDFARRNGIPVGPGRGSAAGSLAAYCVGITDLDPIRYDLLFERFLNQERKSMPDIDVDFCMQGRDRVIDYVTKKYGKDKVAQIITFGRLQAKAVVRDVARVLGFPYADADRIAKLIPEELKITLDQALKKEERLVEEMKKSSGVADLINSAKALEGMPRHASTHAAGIVISDRPLEELLPLYRGNKGETLTQFDMGWVEKIGLVKFDFLGLKTLTVIDNAVKLIERSRGEKLDLKRLPLADPQTMDLLCRGDTLGIFQLESSGMRDIITKFRPSGFEDLIAILALYRPGPLESGMVDDFINRKHGRTAIEYPLPQLEPILRETYGVIVYQEQVMSIARALGDYSLGEADLLRRAMGKKKPEEMAVQKTRFEKGAAKNKIDPEKAAYIFDLMEKFAGYGFNKSHSAAYAVVTYQTAYLKTHYTAEFMAAQLTCEAGNTDKITTYISECRDRGIEILPPHVNESFEDFHVVEGKIIFGLSAVKNVGAGAIKSILAARGEAGPFCNIQDFARRVDLRKVNKKVFESLIKCGAFDGAGYTRRSMFDTLDRVLEEATSFHKEKEAGQVNLFDAECLPGQGTIADTPLPELSEWDELTKLGYEKDMLGFYVTGHPLMKFDKLIARFTNTSADKLGTVAASTPVRLAGLVKGIKEHTTKKGERMAFVSLEDLTGTVEVTVFADVYALTRDVLRSGEPLFVSGSKNGETDNPKVLAQEILPITEVPRRYSSAIHIRISTAGTHPDQITDLKRILHRHNGSLPVTLHVVIPNRTETVIKLRSVTCDASEAFLAEVNGTFGAHAAYLE